MASGLQMGSVLLMPGKPAACLVWRWMVRHNPRKERLFRRRSDHRSPDYRDERNRRKLEHQARWPVVSAPVSAIRLGESYTLLGPGDGLKRMAVDTNEFTGVIQIVCIGSNPCKPFEEQELHIARFRVAESFPPVGTGNRRNDFSYQKYFLPMLSSFKLLK